MEQQGMPTQPSLNAYFRKEELKIALPSKGQFYPPGTLNLDANGEVGVLPMTATDELTMKIPDALLSGESTVKVIESCVPAITNAWLMPAVDVDVILIAIRIATYGEKMGVTSTVPNTGTKQDHDVDLQQVLEGINTKPMNTKCQLDNGLKVICKPNNYQQLSLIRRSTFEKQRLARTINDAKLDDREKQDEFNKIFKSLTEINVESLTNNVDAIETPEGTVNDKTSISEFINNIQLKHVTVIREQLDEMAELGKIPPITVPSPEEDIEKGAPKEYTVPILFDNSDFFASQF
jgi:hypothetical protein